MILSVGSSRSLGRPREGGICPGKKRGGANSGSQSLRTRGLPGPQTGSGPGGP